MVSGLRLRTKSGTGLAPTTIERPLVIDPVLTYATYFSTAISAVAVDTAGDIYVAGQTGAGLPTQSAFQGSLSGSYDGFISKFDPSGQNLIFSTYFGGSGNEWANGLALDSQGNAYISRNSGLHGFPDDAGRFYNAVSRWICNTPFVAKFDPSGSLVYSTLTGGTLPGGRSIAVDVPPEMQLHHGFDRVQRSTGSECVSAQFCRNHQHHGKQCICSKA